MIPGINVHAYKRVPSASIIPWETNPRTHSAAQIDALRRSIREFGFTNPLLIDEGCRLIAGHGRLLAAQAEGLDELPAIELHGLTEAQKRALLLADNQLATSAGWDMELLRLEMGALKEDDFDLSLIGFSEEEIAAILAPPIPEGLTDPDDIPAEPETATSVLGDVWRLGPHMLVCGDATDETAVASALSGVAPHLMVTDPPYGVEYDPEWRLRAGLNKRHQVRAEGRVGNDDRHDWTEAWALFPGHVAYVWHGALHASNVAEGLESSGFEMRSQIIWAKTSLVIGRGHYHWQHEPCWYAVRKGATGHWGGDHKQSTLWQIPNMHRTQGNVDDGKTNHSTQKPVECMRRPILNNSSPGQAVYEPFSGSGTTIIACETTGRSCHALEINPTYVDVAIMRWQAFTGKKAIRADGTSFDDAKSPPTDR